MRLIDVDAVKYEPLPKGERNYRTYDLDDAYDDGYDDAMFDINNMPTIDAVPVIRCKDCTKWDRNDGTFKDFDGKEWHNCKTLCFRTMAYFYCADAEREEENGK